MSACYIRINTVYAYSGTPLARQPTERHSTGCVYGTGVHIYKM